MGVNAIRELINMAIGIIGGIIFWYLSIIGEEHHRSDTELVIWALMTFGFVAFFVVSFAHFVAFLIMGV